MRRSWPLWGVPGRGPRDTNGRSERLLACLEVLSVSLGELWLAAWGLFGGLGCSWDDSAALEPLSADLGAPAAVLGSLVAVLAISWPLLRCAWAALRSLLADLGALWGSSWAALGRSWCAVGASVALRGRTKCSPSVFFTIKRELHEMF